MTTEADEGYMDIHGEEAVAKAAVAAFVVSMDLIRLVRAAGLISSEDLDAIVQNAVAVAQPREGSAVRSHLFANLSAESRLLQDKRNPG